MRLIRLLVILYMLKQMLVCRLQSANMFAVLLWNIKNVIWRRQFAYWQLTKSQNENKCLLSTVCSRRPLQSIPRTKTDQIMLSLVFKPFIYFDLKRSLSGKSCTFHFFNWFCLLQAAFFRALYSIIFFQLLSLPFLWKWSVLEAPTNASWI